MGGKGSGRKRLPENDLRVKGENAWWAEYMSDFNQFTPYQEYFRSEIKGYSAGVDYARATEPLHVSGFNSAELARQWVKEVIQSHGVVTTEPRAQVMLGFKGYQLDSVFCGHSGTHTMYQVSGNTAAKGHNHIPLSADPTRIDLALTVFFREYHPRLAESLANTAAQWQPVSGRPPSLSLIKSYRGEGDTLQLGSRSSEVYVRLYDKFAESKFKEEWFGAWRWEVELKGETAKYVYREYRSGIDLAASCGAIIASICKQRGLPCLGTDYPLRGEVQAPTRAATDYEEKLKWLRRQVAPTLQRLKADGAPDEFLAELLGLGAFGEEFS